LETLLRGWRAAYGLVRLPGIAPGPSTWQEDILLLNHSREIKGPEAISRFRPVPFQ